MRRQTSSRSGFVGTPIAKTYGYDLSPKKPSATKSSFLSSGVEWSSKSLFLFLENGIRKASRALRVSESAPMKASIDSEPFPRKQKTLTKVVLSLRKLRILSTMFIPSMIGRSLTFGFFITKIHRSLTTKFMIVCTVLA